MPSTSQNLTPPTWQLPIYHLPDWPSTRLAQQPRRYLKRLASRTPSLPTPVDLVPEGIDWPASSPSTHDMVSPTVTKQLARELAMLQRTPPDGVCVSLCDSDVLSFSGWIQGPPSTPYAGGFFRITFDFAQVDFPTVPPKCRFATPIFHPNVARNGDICVSSLQNDWKPHYGIQRILLTIKCLLIQPNPDSALDAEASRLMQEDWQSYTETAALWTSVHASNRPACFETAAPEEAPQQATKQAQPPLTPSCSASASQTSTQTPAPRSRQPVPAGPKRGLRRL